jgi:hypothetical protein
VVIWCLVSVWHLITLWSPSGGVWSPSGHLVVIWCLVSPSGHPSVTRHLVTRHLVTRKNLILPGDVQKKILALQGEADFQKKIFSRQVIKKKNFSRIDPR